MAAETEDLVRRLEPIKGKLWVDQRLQEYSDGRFNIMLRKAIEREVKNLANNYNLHSQIILHPVPKRHHINGEYFLGQCHYGQLPLNAKFGLRDSDFIKHIGIFGATGSGKTTTALQIIKQLCEQKKPFLILDPKGTWQNLIKQPYAKNVKVLKLGSTYAPYTFDPFMPLPGLDIDTLISDVVEVFCDSQYLGFGAKSLLQKSCHHARENGKGKVRLSVPNILIQ